MHKNAKQTLIVILVAIISSGLTLVYATWKQSPKPTHQIDFVKSKVVHKSFPIQITPIDTVDGRPTYTVIFSDSTGMDSMYGEEIGASLVTGIWKYNEDYKID